MMSAAEGVAQYDKQNLINTGITYTTTIIEDEEDSSIKVNGRERRGRGSQKKERKCRPLISFIEFMSVGQYRTPLYYHGSDSYSSIGGGLCSIICMILIICFTLTTIIPILKKD